MAILLLRRRGGAERRPGVRRRGVVLLTSVATVLVFMNYSAPLTTLPEIVPGLDAGVVAQTWILNGVPFGLAALGPAAGSLADVLGRRRVFTASMAILSAAMVAGGAAANAAMFVVARIVQGAAGAAIVASSLGILAHAFPEGRDRARATARWGSMISAGIALGPLVAGLPVPGWPRRQEWRAGSRRRA